MSEEVRKGRRVKASWGGGRLGCLVLSDQGQIRAGPAGAQIRNLPAQAQTNPAFNATDKPLRTALSLPPHNQNEAAKSCNAGQKQEEHPDK